MNPVIIAWIISLCFWLVITILYWIAIYNKKQPLSLILLALQWVSLVLMWFLSILSHHWQ